MSDFGQHALDACLPEIAAALERIATLEAELAEARESDAANAESAIDMASECDRLRAELDQLRRERDEAAGRGACATNLVRRFAKYVREDRAVTPRATRLARVTDEADRFLADTNGSPAAPAITVREAARRRLPLSGADAQALEGALALTERELDDARAQLAKVRIDLDAMIAVHDEVEADRDALRTLLTEANRARSRSCDELEQVRSTYRSTEAVLRKRIDELRGERDLARADLARVTAERDAADRFLRALRDQVETGGCAAAHAGETTYECRPEQTCGLCRLRQRAERAERERDEATRAGELARTLAERMRAEVERLTKELADANDRIGVAYGVRNESISSAAMERLRAVLGKDGQ
jgi:chromosome segregation ATPase